MRYYLTGTSDNGNTADGNNKIYATILNVTDGTSNTLLLAERYAYNCKYDSTRQGNRTWGDIGGASLWSPILIHTDLFEVTPKIGVHSCYVPQAYTASGCQVALMDGSVRNAQRGISATTWWRLWLPRDGQVIGDW